MQEEGNLLSVGMATTFHGTFEEEFQCKPTEAPPFRGNDGEPHGLSDGEAYVARERDVVIAMRNRLQTPPAGKFSKADLTWAPHVNVGRGVQKQVKVAVISWDRLNDFIEGEQTDPQFPTTFTREVMKKQAPATLSHPRGNSSTLQVR